MHWNLVHVRMKILFLHYPKLHELGLIFQHSRLYQVVDPNGRVLADLLAQNLRLASNTFLPEHRRVIYLLVNVHDDIKRSEILDLLGKVSFALPGDEVDFLRRLVQIAGYKKELEVLIVIKLVVSVLNV